MITNPAPEFCLLLSGESARPWKVGRARERDKSFCGALSRSQLHPAPEFVRRSATERRNADGFLKRTAARSSALRFSLPSRAAAGPSVSLHGRCLGQNGPRMFSCLLCIRGSFIPFRRAFASHGGSAARLIRRCSGASLRQRSRRGGARPKAWSSWAPSAHQHIGA
jgi:hypothetical protein